MVKIADRISNLQKPLACWNNEKIKKYGEEAIFIYNELKEANNYLADRLKTKIDEYKKCFC